MLSVRQLLLSKDNVFGTETEIFDKLMSKQGYDTNATSTAAEVGQQMASTLLGFRHNDGSNQLGTSKID